MTIATRRPGRPPKAKDVTLAGQHRLQRAGLHEQAAEQLRRMIVHGALRPGAPLIEGELSDALGISRTPLREALKLLAQQGLVELRANRSASVRAMRAEQITELFEALAGVERLAAELAAQRITAAELEELAALQEVIVRDHRAGQREPYFAANRRIHRLIVEAGRNTALADIHAALLDRAEQVRFFALRLEDRWEQSIVEHQEILDAITARDGDRAGRLLGAHVGHTADTVARCLAAGWTPSRDAA